MTNSAPSGSIVVGIEGIDGWPESRRALEWAVDHAGREERPLLIAHASGREPTPMARDRQAAREARLLNGEGHVNVARGLARDLAPGLDVRTIVRATGATDLLLELADSAHMVVVGSRGLGPVAGVVHGSVSVTLASHASVPVVIVRGNPGEWSPRVVVGANGQEDAAGALELGFAEAAARGVPLTILTCVDDGAVDRSALEQQAGTLALKYEGVETDLAVAHGSAAEALVEASRSADLVVVGARRRHSRAAALLGSVGLAVVQRSSCTVAVVRPPDRAAR